MQSLKEVKSIIFQTECKELIREGLSCSEPVMTRDETGLIDNYFIYACNEDETQFSKPITIFGVYSDLKRKAYSVDKVDFEDKVYKVAEKSEDSAVLSAYNIYSAEYLKVRDFAFCDCNEEQRGSLKRYMDTFRLVSGSVLWHFYQQLFPSFFTWANEQLK